MADRAAQIVSEWFVKCANVVLQSRIVLDATEGKQNRWVRPTRPAQRHHPVHATIFFSVSRVTNECSKWRLHVFAPSPSRY